jgi:L-asparaginase
MAYDDKVLGGEGAIKFAREQGFEPYSTETFERRAEYDKRLASKGKGTVGCVALDKDGNIAAATSTGGKGFEMVGRISDSATVAGNYANKYCGVSCTGVGEDIVSNATAAKIVTRVTDGMTIKEAFEKTFKELKRDGLCGAIAIDHKGNIYHQDSEPSMVFAGYDGEEYEVFN